MKKFVIVMLVLAAPLVLLAAKEEEKAGHSGPTKAIAVVHGFGKSPVKGVVHFTVMEDGVEIGGQLSGLKPGKHGFHIHEFGDCSSGEAKCRRRPLQSRQKAARRAGCRQAPRRRPRQHYR